MRLESYCNPNLSLASDLPCGINLQLNMTLQDDNNIAKFL